MRKRGKTLILLGCLLLVATTISLLLLRAREPHYDGRSLSDWYRLWATSTKTNGPAAPLTQEAMEAIRHIGTNALPILLARVRHPDTPFQTAANQIVGLIPDRVVASGPFQNTLGRAVHPGDRCIDPIAAFWILGPIAAPAVPELKILIKSARPRTAQTAAHCLAMLGDEGVLPLLAALADRTVPDRTRASVAQLFIYSDALRGLKNISLAAPVLADCALSSDPALAAAAITALGKVHTQPEIAIRALTNSACSANPMLRRLALTSLASYGRQYVTILTPFLKDPDELVRRTATNYVKSLAPELFTNSLQK